MRRTFVIAWLRIEGKGTDTLLAALYVVALLCTRDEATSRSWVSKKGKISRVANGDRPCYSHAIPAIFSFRSCSERISYPHISIQCRGQKHKTYLFNGPIDDISCDLHLLFLTEPQRPRDGLVLYAWVPLRLDDEDAVRCCEVESDILLVRLEKTVI